MKLKKGDLVTVTTGKERGKKGKILRVLPEENRLVLESLNFVKVYTRPSQQNPKGGITQVEGKLHRSNVQLVCPRCSKPTRVGFQFLADKTKQRVCKKCNEII
ncbi:MAG: 50S ribosomal protein L24 [Omnitrophica bacterium RIFCSPHIGHO2_02_FULL_46_11]|nr:MAG: 50S ribosomal protein L24 [Omnitrophica bacterium RIFCSPHIGHO2_02_FULL_46_11]OGW86981.1 MAG: 50S ribosomal protein L24 [Omnitrophica bacterium RIFCSPLOWO2_01_FULL_45_10b]